jgi:hypothetical protein
MITSVQIIVRIIFRFPIIVNDFTAVYQHFPLSTSTTFKLNVDKIVNDSAVTSINDFIDANFGTILNTLTKSLAIYILRLALQIPESLTKRQPSLLIVQGPPLFY